MLKKHPKGLCQLTSLSDQFFAVGKQTSDFGRRSLLQSTVVNEPSTRALVQPVCHSGAPASPDCATALGQTGK